MAGNPTRDLPALTPTSPVPQPPERVQSPLQHPPEAVAMNWQILRRLQGLLPLALSGSTTADARRGTGLDRLLLAIQRQELLVAELELLSEPALTTASRL